MKNFLRSKFLLIGVLAGLLTGGGWLAWATIQQEVGINLQDQVTKAWRPAQFATAGTLIAGDSNTIPIIPTVTDPSNDDTLHRIQAPNTDGRSNNNLLPVNVMGFNGGSFDRIRSFGNNADSIGPDSMGLWGSTSFIFGFNGVNYDRITTSGDTRTTGAISVNEQLFNGANYNQSRAATGDGASSTGNSIPQSGNVLYNNTAWDRRRGISSGNLIATTSLGTQLTAQLTTWSQTSAPGAGNQATASKVSGGGTVRHVATAVSACIADTAAAAAPIQVNLRDGATGAGTILRSWLLGTAALAESRCINESGFSIIGTAATAMTLELAAAGAATTLQTANLSGFSVP